MDEDITNKQTNDNSEGATERERRLSEEQRSGESSRTNPGSTEASRPNVAEEYLNKWKRERADFLNYKKDEVKRLEEFVKFANEAVILEMIDALDDLELAAKEVKNKGLNQVLKKFQDLLKKYNVERMAVGDKFDPLLYEAMETEEGGEKLEEVRAGYTMNGKIIRPARVKIIK